MPLESAGFISELVATNPTGADDYATADDHLRLLKAVLLAQFPNLTAAAVNATVDELNTLVGITALVADLNLLAGADAVGLTAAELLLLNGQTQLLTQSVIHATVEQTKTNDGILADDDVLVLPVTTGRYYAIDAFLAFASDVSAESLRFTVQAPAGSTLQQYIITDAASGFAGQVQATTGVVIVIDSSGADASVHVTGKFRAGSTNDVAIQWSQSVADAGWTLSRRVGSYLKLIELG